MKAANLDVNIYKTSTNKKVWAKFYVANENEAVYTTNEVTIKPVTIDSTWTVTATGTTATYNGKNRVLLLQ